MTASAGFDPTAWTSTGIGSAVEVESPASADGDALLEPVDTVAGIPRALRPAPRWSTYARTVPSGPARPPVPTGPRVRTGSSPADGVREGVVMATGFQVTFDSADPGRHAAFWAEVLHYVPAPPPAGFGSWEAALEAWGVPPEHRNDRAALVDPDGRGPRLFFQKVPEPKTAKNRVHLDVRAAADRPPEERNATLDAEYERLTALGARLVNRLEPNGIDDLCIVMQDPEGNEFCLD